MKYVLYSDVGSAKLYYWGDGKWGFDVGKAKTFNRFNPLRFLYYFILNKKHEESVRLAKVEPIKINIGIDFSELFGKKK